MLSTPGLGESCRAHVALGSQRGGEGEGKEGGSTLHISLSPSYTPVALPDLRPHNPPGSRGSCPSAANNREKRLRDGDRGGEEGVGGGEKTIKPIIHLLTW